MNPYEDDAVRAIYAACHPKWPERAPRWFEAHPTLVLLAHGSVVGYTSYSLVVRPETCQDGEVMLGYGIDIAPGHWGMGYGRKLCDARLEVARAVGAKVFVGHAAPTNHAMIRLFEQDGFRPMSVGSGAYPDGTDMVVFMGPI
jgi:RimJ/RimL family protein N-acetyltransferase